MTKEDLKPAAPASAGAEGPKEHKELSAEDQETIREMEDEMEGLSPTGGPGMDDGFDDNEGTGDDFDGL